MNHTSPYIIAANAPISAALDKLNKLSGGAMTLFVQDTHNRIIGSLTDGDIRRALLSGITVNNSVTQAMNSAFKAVNTHGDTPHHVVQKLRLLRQSGIVLVPDIDDDGTLSDIIDLHKTSSRLPLNAILMAGGIGERLRPLTLDTPKPLLKIEHKAIIDYNVEALANAGITNISVIARYLAEQLYNHFANPVAGVNVKCFTEDIPLGTIGGASLALDSQSPNNHTLVMNSDLLTTVSFEDMYLRHIAEDADISIAVLPYTLSVPYAILATDQHARVTAIHEKPTYSYFANAGIYILKNKILQALTPNQRIDATDMVQNVIDAGGKVICHPINGTWIDIGSPDEFRRAQEMMRHHHNLLRR